MGKQQVKIVLFSGGRGTSIISAFLLDRLNVKLTVAVNAYDDGLSTGRLRAFIPGMLGPSDVRKNITSLMHCNDDSQRKLKYLLEFRFDENVSQDDALACLYAIARLNPAECPFPEIEEALICLKFHILRSMSVDIQKFIDYFLNKKEKGIVFNFGDCSLGNILFSGHYLRSGKDFNRCCMEMSEFCSCRADVINVTCGENLVLTALKEDLSYLSRESEIVSKQLTPSPIVELFLLPEYLKENQEKELKNIKNSTEKYIFLRKMETYPSLNPELAERIFEADMIIYGPGTQHSSLLPSYVTRNLTETISANKNASKVFICNIAKDHDIQMESVDSILGKFAFYASRKGAIHDLDKDLSSLISHAFIQKDTGNEQSRLHYFKTGAFPIGQEKNLPLPERLKVGRGLSEIYVRDWEDAPGKHHGFLVERELLGILERQMQLEEKRGGAYLLSIVIPALNEASSVERVLRELQAEDMASNGILKEIILVDGGSTDGTADIAEKIEGVKVIRLPVNTGYGAALLAGFDAARGALVATFPADGEYLTSELVRAVTLVQRGDAAVCFGSRMIKCLNLDDVLLKIYNGKKGAYLLSKYGGLSLSIASFLRYGQFLSDPLTQLRVFNYDFLKSLKLCRKNFSIISEMIAKSYDKRQCIFEVPVTYLPRQQSDGKKMCVKSGLQVLFGIVFSKF